MLQRAANPDGERAIARNQPPNVPNKKKNGNSGGCTTPARRIRMISATYNAGQPNRAKMRNINRKISIDSMPFNDQKLPAAVQLHKSKDGIHATPKGNNLAALRKSEGVVGVNSGVSQAGTMQFGEDYQVRPAILRWRCGVYAASSVQTKKWPNLYWATCKDTMKRASPRSGVVSTESFRLRRLVARKLSYYFSKNAFSFCSPLSLYCSLIQRP